MPVVYVSAKERYDLTVEQLLAHASEHIAERAAFPRTCRIWTSLPKTAVGKIQKNLLRIDAVQQALQAALAHAGLDADCALTVEDRGAGGIVAVASTAGVDSLDARIQAVLGGFSVRYEIRMQPPAHILSSLQEGVLTLTINRPEKKNALTIQMYAQLADALKQADSAADVRVVLIQGAEGNFTSGNDVGLFVDTDDSPKISPALPFLRAVVEMRKPLIACVEGVAVGVGATILAHCDVVVASETVRIRYPFVNLGLCPEFGSTLLLPQIVGARRADQWLLLGEFIDAQEAYQAGLLTYLVSAGMAQEKAASMALTLSLKPAQALAATRALLKEGQREALLRQIGLESTHFASLRVSQAAQEIFRSFLAKT